MRTTDSPRRDGEVASAGVERARLVVILGTIGISVSGMTLFSLVPWSDWRTAPGTCRTQKSDNPAHNGH